MKKKIQVDPNLLITFCQALLDLERLETDYYSQQHRESTLESRPNLGARLFKARLKIPAKEEITLSTMDAQILFYAIQQSISIENEKKDRAIRILHPIIC